MRMMIRTGPFKLKFAGKVGVLLIKADWSAVADIDMVRVA